MHQHLRDFPAVRLILRLVQDDLHCADDGVCFLGYEHSSLAAHSALGYLGPVSVRFGARYRVEKADGRAALHAIDEHLAQTPDLPIADALRAVNLKDIRHFLVLLNVRECS
jgi:hypothetical protein